MIDFETHDLREDWMSAGEGMNLVICTPTPKYGVWAKTLLARWVSDWTRPQAFTDIETPTIISTGAWPMYGKLRNLRGGDRDKPYMTVGIVPHSNYLLGLIRHDRTFISTLMEEGVSREFLSEYFSREEILSDEVSLSSAIRYADDWVNSIVRNSDYPVPASSLSYWFRNKTRFDPFPNPNPAEVLTVRDLVPGIDKCSTMDKDIRALPREGSIKAGKLAASIQLLIQDY